MRDCHHRLLASHVNQLNFAQVVSRISVPVGVACHHVAMSV